MANLLNMSTEEIRTHYSIIITNTYRFTMKHNLTVLTKLKDFGVFDTNQLADIFNVSLSGMYKALTKLNE